MTGRAGKLDAGLEFRMLGSLEVYAHGVEATPTAPKLRQVLTLLAMRSNQLVRAEELFEELWGDDRPRSAQLTLQTYIHKLRKTLFPPESAPTHEQLETGHHGYSLSAPAGSIDIKQFDELAKRGELALEEGRPEQASELLRAALALWRGPAMAGVNTGSLLSVHAAQLEEYRLQAIDARIEAELQLGQHRRLITELKGMVAAQPLHEGFSAQLMIALYRCQRRPEALELYQNLRRNMVGELGLEPSPSLQRLHLALLTNEVDSETLANSRMPSRRPVVKGVASGTVNAVVDGVVNGAPAQLPNDIVDFIGRADEVRAAVEYLCPAGDGAANNALSVASMTGLPGVGKSTLAVHVAQRVRSHFTDGQFFAKLCTDDGTPKDPGDVLRSFLTAAGLGERQLPAGLDDRANLFRTWSSDRSVLVVLDDATSANQVQSLLPAGPRCAVIVTSRRSLDTLPGVHAMKLESMYPADSVALLGAIVGTDRVQAERVQAERIVELCGHLPLAVRSVGARLRSAPIWPIQSIRDLLEDSRRRLDVLAFGGIDVRCGLASTVADLPQRAQEVFRLLATLPLSGFTVAEAAGVLGQPEQSVEITVLLRLVGDGLLRPCPETKDGLPMLGFHPLAYCYALELLSDRPIGTGLAVNRMRPVR